MRYTNFITITIKQNNMTAKEKAKKLVDRFNEHIEYDTNFKDETSKAKKRALICVDEVLKVAATIADKKFDFYTEVKQEINKL